jgi:CheY-like chemotaxis protein
MSRNVLIVEDGYLFARFCGSLLRPLDCDVVHVRTKTDALRLLERERPDLIVMGLHFPDGSGIDAIRVIRSRAALRDTPIIAMTMHVVSTDEAKMKDAGCTALVERPLRVDEFTALAQRYIDQPAAGRAPENATKVWAGIQTDLSAAF